jgi:intracellular protein transport protein USO1
MVQSLVSQSPDIQKILAFEGAFEKLMNTITQEGGIEGGVVVHDALKCVYALLHYNTSNQVRTCFVTIYAGLPESIQLALELF